MLGEGTPHLVLQNNWMILIMSDDWQLTVGGTNDLLTEWNDDCPGLVVTKSREVEWKC
jgi:hypothetical protein